MHFDINKFKGYMACKKRSQAVNSLLEAFENRYKLEKDDPGITFSNPHYGKDTRFAATAYYMSDGFDFLDVMKTYGNTDVSLAINKKKLDAFLDNDNYDSFDNISQALSVLALGNTHDILRSENFIRQTFQNNKLFKKAQLTSSPSFKLSPKTTAMKNNFRNISIMIDEFFKTAHAYIATDYIPAF